jgi:branched-chain amino acid transport system substrate-binding protein
MLQKSLLLLFVVLLALAGCQAAPIQAPSGPQTYVLGIAQPFTGSLGSFGTDFGKGIELAVEQMNSQLQAAGSNVQFQTASADTEGTPEGAAKAVQTIAQTSGAKVVVGPLTTGEVLGAKQFADENQIVLVAPASSAPAGAIPDDYVFRVMYPPDLYAGQAFAQIANARGYENVAILAVDDPFGNGMVDVFTEHFQAGGGGEVAVVKYAPEPTDLSGEVASTSAEVARLSAEGPTAFFAVAFLGDAQKVIQQALTDEALGSVDWLGVENLVNPDILQDPAHAEFLANAKMTSVSFADRANPNTQPFIDAFKAKYNSDPGPFTNYAYDAANVAMLSMLAANNSGSGVKSILPYIATHYIGTSVQTHLDENGDQAVVYYGIFQLNPEGTEFEQIGSYDGATGLVTFD